MADSNCDHLLFISKSRGEFRSYYGFDASAVFSNYILYHLHISFRYTNTNSVSLMSPGKFALGVWHFEVVEHFLWHHKRNKHWKTTSTGSTSVAKTQLKKKQQNHAVRSWKGMFWDYRPGTSISTVLFTHLLFFLSFYNTIQLKSNQCFKNVQSEKKKSEH